MDSVLMTYLHDSWLPHGSLADVRCFRGDVMGGFTLMQEACPTLLYEKSLLLASLV